MSVPTNAGIKLRQARRDSLREMLSAQGHEQHVLVLLAKLEDLEDELDSVQYQRIKTVIETKMKIISKYLPDDKEPTDLNIAADLNVTCVRKGYKQGEN